MAVAPHVKKGLVDEQVGFFVKELYANIILYWIWEVISS